MPNPIHLLRQGSSIPEGFAGQSLCDTRILKAKNLPNSVHRMQVCEGCLQEMDEILADADNTDFSAFPAVEDAWEEVEAAPAAQTVHLKIRTGELNSVVDANTACGLKDMQFIYQALDKPEDLKAFLERMTPPKYTGARRVCPKCIEAVGKRSTGFLEQGFVCLNCEALEHQFCFNTACTCCAGQGRGASLSGV